MDNYHLFNKRVALFGYSLYCPGKLISTYVDWIGSDVGCPDWIWVSLCNSNKLLIGIYNSSHLQFKYNVFMQLSKTEGFIPLEDSNLILQKKNMYESLCSL